MGKILAAYGGGFKPPTGGHFEIVKKALQEFPEIDEFTVFVGGKIRDGIEQVEAIQVWEIYKKYLANKVDIQPSTSPIGDILRLAKDNPQDLVYFIIGYREGRDDDVEDVLNRTSNLEQNYPNIMVKVIPTYDPNMSGTNARKALEQGEEEFIKFLPDEVEEKYEIWDIVRPAVNEVINENATYTKKINLINRLSNLTQHMLDKGMNIEPLPTIEFKDGDVENAGEFLGKTAYYNPNTQTIALYTEGRHPKDITRSYAHEMVHHIQYLEGRLNNITTTNTLEDDNLNKLEQEANLIGTMTFRNWTDSLNESKPYKHKSGFDDKLGKDPFGLNQFAREIAEEVLNEGKYDSLITKLAGFTLNAWKGDFEDGQTKGYFEVVVGPGEEFDYPHLRFKYIAKSTFYDAFKSSGIARPQQKLPEVELDYWIPADELPELWSGIAMDIRNTIRHEIEHLMQSGSNVKKGKEMGDDSSEREELKTGKKPWWKIWRQKLDSPYYYKLEKEIDANLQGLYLQAKKTRKPLEDIIDNYLKYQLNLDIKDQEDIKTLWRERAPKLNIPLFENKEEYKIFSDMDGVITDFDKRYKKYSGGIHPSVYEKKYGKAKFWELPDAEGVAFWVGMPWMEDGKQYWDYIKDYNVEFLSSPSRSATSRLGKRLWVRNNTPGVKLTLAQAYNKKNYAAPNHILIDDRKSNIDDWRAEGGIGILHTSTADTIKQLKKLGL